jgi:hypothetical protein
VIHQIFLEFNFYEPLWYCNEIAAFPEPKGHIGRWLGQAFNVGQAMCYWILPPSGILIARSTVIPLSLEDLTLESVQQELIDFDQQIKSKYCKDDDIDKNSIDIITDQTDDQGDHMTPEFDSIEEPTPEADNWDQNAYDQYIAAEVILPVGEQSMLGKVIERKRDHDGQPIGQAHYNPLLDTRIYQVEFPDGHCEEYSANTIAECLYSQVDSEGKQYLLINEIIIWEATDHALDELWKNGSTSWETLAAIKEAFPIQVSKFTVDLALQDKVAFKWWVPQVIKRHSRINKAIKTRYAKKTHKFGIRLPKSVQEAYEIDKQHGNGLWHRAIIKEMKKNALAFCFLEPGESPQ